MFDLVLEARPFGCHASATRTTNGIRAWATLGLFGGVDQFGSSTRASFGEKGEIFLVKTLSFLVWIYSLFVPHWFVGAWAIWRSRSLWRLFEGFVWR